MIRATTGGVMKTYRSNLMNSFINMNASRNTVLTQRTFNSFAEDPAAAAKAFRLRKSRMTVESQYAVCTDVMGKYQQAVSCLQSNDDVLCTKSGEYGMYMKTLTGTTLKMLNDPTGDAREQLTKALDQMSQQIIQTMNQKYGDNFIFAGADGHNVPFEIKDNKLYYRGVPVDAAMPNVLTDANGNPLAVSVDSNGQLVVDPNGTDYYNMDGAEIITQAEYEKLYNLPVVEGADTGTLVEYNEDGTPFISDPDDPAYEHYKVGGYYWVENEYEDDAGTVKKLISKDEYEAIEARQGNEPALLTTDGTAPYEYVNEAGETCYIVYDESQLMAQSDYDQQKLDWEKLQYLARETEFVDIGFGFQEDPVTGKLIESSAFDAALNGINFLGYGLDEDGDPKNIYSLVQRMREVAENVKSGTDWDDGTYNEFHRLVGKFEDAVSNYQTEFVNLDASTGKLKGQQELLVDNFDTLREQYSDIEDVDMVDAITSFIWAEYCYNAALKVGNNILSESLMDYLR